jgi:hypothetical protein
MTPDTTRIKLVLRLVLAGWMLGVMALAWLILGGPGVSSVAKRHAGFERFVRAVTDAFGYVADSSEAGGEGS